MVPIINLKDNADELIKSRGCLRHILGSIILLYELLNDFSAILLAKNDGQDCLRFESLQPCFRKEKHSSSKTEVVIVKLL